MSEIDMKPKSFLTEEAKKDIQNLLDIDSGGGGGGTSIEIDDTLTVEGAAADAKATGDAIANIHMPEPSEEQIAEAVTAWLNAHPEATTTVEDGSITYAKLNSAVSEDIVGAKNALSVIEIVNQTPLAESHGDLGENEKSVVIQAYDGHEISFGCKYI